MVAAGELSRGAAAVPPRCPEPTRGLFSPAESANHSHPAVPVPLTKPQQGLSVLKAPVPALAPAAERPSSSLGIHMPSAIPTSSLLPGSSSPISAALSRKRGYPFNQSQSALALAIVRGRPEDASPADYARQLRGNAKVVDNRNVLDRERHYIDSAEHWKEQCKVHYNNKKALEDKVHRLEEKLRIWKRIAQNADEPPSTDTESEIPEGWNEEPIVMSPNDQHQLRMSSYVVRLGGERNDLDNLNTLLSDPNNIEDATKQVIRHLALLENALLDCCTPLEVYQPKEPWQNSRSFTNLRRVTYQVKLGFFSCFTTLNKICETIPGRTMKKGVILYKMVSFVGKAIKLLHILCKNQTEHRRSREGEQEVYAVNKCLTCTIVAIMGLDWEVGKPGHAELLEGILFTILEHTGSLLSVAFFGEDMATKKQRRRKDQNNTPTVNTTNAESLYMVQILYSALGGAEKQKLISRVLMGGDGAELIEKAKRSIQGTLLKYTYGTRHIEALSSPALPEDEVAIPRVEYDGEIYGPDWLINMATSIVGWDLVLPQ